MKITNVNVSIEPWITRESKVLRIVVRSNGQTHTAEEHFDPSDLHAPIDVIIDEAKKRLLHHLKALDKTGKL